MFDEDDWISVKEIMPSYQEWIWVKWKDASITQHWVQIKNVKDITAQFFSTAAISWMPLAWGLADHSE